MDLRLMWHLILNYGSVTTFILFPLLHEFPITDSRRRLLVFWEQIRVKVWPDKFFGDCVDELSFLITLTEINNCEFPIVSGIKS